MKMSSFKSNKLSNFVVGLVAFLSCLVLLLGVGVSYPVFEDYSGTNNITPGNGSQYSPNEIYNFTVNITDNVTDIGSIENVTFQLGRPNGSYFNFTNNATNNLNDGYKDGPFNSSEIWWMNFTQDQIGPAGIYNFTWYAYNSTGSGNNSATVVYNISRNQTNSVNLTIQNSTDTYAKQNVTVTYPSWTDTTGLSVYQNSGSVFIFRNGTNKSSSENVTLGAGTYEYKVNITGNENYTANGTGATYFVFVDEGDPSFYTNLYLDNGTSDPTTITYPNVAEVRGNISTIPGAKNLEFNLYRNDTHLDGGNTTNQTVDSTRLANGTYEFRYNTSGGNNWTSGSANLTLEVLKGPQKLTLELDGNKTDTTYEKGNQANITVYSNITLNNITANMTLISNFTQPNGSIPINFTGTNTIQNLTDTGNLALGKYKISANISETQNYTAVLNNSLIMTVQDITKPNVSIHGYENATFKKANDTLNASIYLTDNDEFDEFNVSVYVENSTYIFAGNISNSTVAGSKKIWANGSVSIPSGLTDGNHTLEFNVSDPSNNIGSNDSYVVQIDNTKPPIKPSHPSSIDENDDITFDCSISDSGSGLSSHELEITLPDDSKVTKNCDETFTDTSLVGTYDVKYTATDKVGNTNSKTSSFEVENVYYGGGGGPEVPPEVSHIWSKLVAGEISKVKIDKKGLEVNGISIKPNKDKSNVKVTIKKYDSRPSDVSSDPVKEGKTYNYLEINLQNLKDEDIASSSIEFFVGKKWLSENNFSKENVILKRYTGDKWEGLETKITGEDKNNVYFKAKTSGYSYFAVAAKKVTEEKTKKPTTTTIEKTTTTTTPTKETTTTTVGKGPANPKSFWEQWKLPIILILAVIFIIVIFFLFRSS